MEPQLEARADLATESENFKILVQKIIEIKNYRWMQLNERLANL